MNYNIKTIVIALLGSVIISCIFMLFAVVKFAQLEHEVAVQRADLYAVKLVQTVLLEQHSIKLELAQPVHDLQEQNKEHE